MGPIKINIKTSQIEASSEYGGCDSVDVDKEELSEAAEVKPVERDESCYSYEGEECFYTEPASGTVLRWDRQSNTWVTRDQPDTSQASPNYKMEDGTYVYVDKLTGQKHKWNLETNQWDKVDKAAGEVDDEEEEESEEDENMSEEERKARQYRKRKAAPGWDQSNYSKVVMRCPH